MKRSSKVGFVASIALALVIVASLLAGVRNVGAVCSSPCWHHMSSPNVGSGDNVLNGVFAFSDSDVWAVGYDITTTNVAQTLIENYNGTSWSVISSPSPGSSSYLKGVASNPYSLTPSDVWAVGYYTTTSATKTLIEQYHNGSWNIYTSTNPSASSNVLNGVAGSSNTDYWAVGYDYSSTTGVNVTLAEHYTSTVSGWQQVSTPNPGSSLNNYLTSVTVVSPTMAWAAGYNDNGPTLLKWDGSAWSDQTITLPSTSAPVASGISFNGPYGWMVGLDPQNLDSEFAFQHDLFGSWLEIDPSIGSLTGIDTLAFETAWTVGVRATGAIGRQATSAYWNGKQWTEYDAETYGTYGDQFNALSALAREDVWGVGYSLGTGNTTFVEKFY